MSRLPRKEPKTFDNFDFSRIHGKDVEVLKNISTLAPLYARKNMAFIGPQGIGKTHMAMAFGRAVCEQRMKAYFLKATELNQKLTNARKYGNVASVTNGLVRPSCLIIDEVGRCVFDEANTQIFFDIIDRRSNKEGPNCMIFTSNKNPSTWGKYFIEQDSLLCALDRFFDDSMVFMIKGESYRGRKTETISLEAGISKSIK
jgi:DNA replication protein DnaC